MSKKTGMGKFIAGAAIGAGLGLLFAPKSGNETRKELKGKLDDLLAQIKNIDVAEVKDEFNRKVQEIKDGLADLDREKVISIAKDKGNALKVKAQELVDMAKEKGTPKLKKTAQDILENVIKASKETIKKLDETEK